VRAAFREIESSLAARGLRGGMEGVVLQEMVEGGVEAFVGATHDPLFGPLVAFGIGGVHVEVWKDVVFRVHPLSRADARDMMDQIRGKALLDGVRGAPPADRDALADVILRVDRLVGDHPRILEVDLNPLVALARGAVAVDARVRVGAAGVEKPASGAGRGANFSSEMIDSHA
jgi:acyl-CoA synthetase (NDP forming)